MRKYLLKTLLKYYDNPKDISSVLYMIIHLIYSRHNKKVAAGKVIVAVVRKLTTRIFAVLIQQRNYVVDNRKGIFSLKKEEPMLLQGETRLTAESVTTVEGSFL